MSKVSGFKVEGLDFKVQGSGVRSWGLEARSFWV